MKNPQRAKQWLALSITCPVVILCLTWGETKAGTVAYWRFEPGNLGADSSANGNTLTVAGAASSADKATNAPGTGSAVFDGSSFAQTLAALDLTNDTAITLEWFMKTDQQDLGIIYEHSANYNANRGGLLADISENAIGRLSVGNSGQPGYALKEIDIPPDGGWHHYAVTIDSRSTSAGRLKIYVDGLRATNLTQNALIGNPQAFLDATFNIGARDGSALFFKG